MTRTNPSKTKPRMEKTTDRKQADRKQIIFTEGAKGGGGKTTLLSSLADFFLAENIPIKLVDADCPAPRLFVGTGHVQRRIISWELARELRRDLTRQWLDAVYG